VTVDVVGVVGVARLPVGVVAGQRRVVGLAGDGFFLGVVPVLVGDVGIDGGAAIDRDTARQFAGAALAVLLGQA
jgi:hypothetical protein